VGLADVVGHYQNTRIKPPFARVVIPCYDTKFKKENKFECVHWGFVKLGKFDFHLMYSRKQLIS
jgi:starch synthase